MSFLHGLLRALPFPLSAATRPDDGPRPILLSAAMREATLDQLVDDGQMFRYDRVMNRIVNADNTCWLLDFGACQPSAPLLTMLWFLIDLAREGARARRQRLATGVSHHVLLDAIAAWHGQYHRGPRDRCAHPVCQAAGGL